MNIGDNEQRPSGVMAKKRRTWKGRSKSGCDVCKRRRVKCDEEGPLCKNCLKAGLDCDGPKSWQTSRIALTKPQSARVVIPVYPNRSEIERKTFHLYLHIVAPLVSGGSSYSQDFWIKSACSTAHQEESVFSAILAMIAIFTIPRHSIKNDGVLTISRKVQQRYELAIEWYTRSVKELCANSSCSSAAQLSTLILGSILYFMCELRLGNVRNMNTLIQNAFQLIHSYQNVLCQSGDLNLLASLYQLLYTPIISEINGAIIPKAHRQAAFVVALAVANKAKADRGYSLGLQYLSIAWDVNDTIYNNLDPLQLDLDERFRHYYQSHLQNQHSDKPFFESHKSYTIAQIQWQIYREGFNLNERKLWGRLDYVLSWLERWAQWLHGCKTIPLWELDLRLLPLCILVAWYVKTEDVLERITKLLEGFNDQKSIIKSTLEYITTLVATERDQPTALELELFGERPKVLQIWQAHVITRRLIEKSQDVRLSAK